MYNVGLIGCGNIAETYFRSQVYFKNIKIVSCADINEEAAKEALAVWKGGLQVGGGINDKNAKQWIDWGADKVCECLWEKIISAKVLAGYNHIFPLPVRQVLSRTSRPSFGSSWR